jgi:hypothetical protein
MAGIRLVEIVVDSGGMMSFVRELRGKRVELEVDDEENI